MTEVYASARTAAFPGGAPVEGVVVRLYTSGGAFVTSATTNAVGLAYLGARAAADYEIRISAPAPSVVQNNTIQKITVPNSPDNYAFDITVTTANATPASDTLLCRCSGYFKDSHGTPLAGVTISFSETASTPALLYYSGANITHAVVPTNIYVHTDKTGFASVDLIRKSIYSIISQGYESYPRVVTVPDLSSASLPDVLFPSVHRIEWVDNNAVIMPTTAPTLALTVDQVKELKVQTVFRSGVISSGLKDVTVESSDPAVVSITCGSDGAVTLVANGAGTAEIMATRVMPEAGKGVTVYPEPALFGSLAVTVAP